MTAGELLFRTGTQATWTTLNPVLALGEPGLITDTNELIVGDGTSLWSALKRYKVSGSTVLLPDGTTALPSLTFESDAEKNTGIYRPAADVIGFSVAGVAKARIVDLGLETTNGWLAALSEAWGIACFIEGPNAATTGLYLRGRPAQTADMQVWVSGETGTPLLSRIDKGGRFATRVTAAPADADLANGEFALHLDDTAGAPRAMAKGKDSAGTVFSHDLSSPTILTRPPNERTTQGNSGTAIAIDFDGPPVRHIDMTGNVAAVDLTFVNPPGAGESQSVMLILKQDATGNRTITWPATVLFPGGTDVVLSTAANAIDIITLVASNVGGTLRYYAFLGGKAFA